MKKYDKLLQKYLHGITSRTEERELLDIVLKGLNKAMGLQRQMIKLSQELGK